MRRVVPIYAILLSLFISFPALADTKSSSMYQLYLEWGKNAINEKDYDSAKSFFSYAQTLSDGEEASEYINLIKRIEENRIDLLTEPEKGLYDSLTTAAPKPAVETPKKYNQPEQKPLNISTPLKSVEPMELPSIIAPAPKPVDKVFVPEKASILAEENAVVYLNEEVARSQPNTVLRIPLKSSIILESKNIERFLVITPDYLVIQKLDRDHVKIDAVKRGTTLLHLWDDARRWTFKIEVTLPKLVAPAQVQEKQAVEYVKPFTITYFNDWNSFYRGNSFDNVKRRNLNFVQTLEGVGETPYGNLSGFVIFNKFDLSTEVTGYGVGLQDGHVGPFEDFNISGFDTQKTFSPLTLSGQYFRGIMFESKAFNKTIEYTYLHGKDRSTFGFLSPGVIEEKDSYVEGFEVTLFPEKEDQVSFNYARGYGTAREDYLSDQVYSIEARKRVKNVLLAHETAYDTDYTANLSSAKLNGDNYDADISFRDINKRFSTVSSLPSNRGEVGGMVNLNYHTDKMNVYSNIDLYRDRLFFNVVDPNAVNLDYSTLVEIPLTLTDLLKGAVYYTDTRQEISPRNNMRLIGNYSKRLKIFGKRDLSAFFAGTYQRSRFDLTPSSEYDRYSLSSGITLNIIRNLNYYINYEYSWVDELSTNEILHPNVMTSGLNYTRMLTEQLAGNFNLAYRNEEQTEGQNSFLAGEDSLVGSVGLTFSPKEDFELFLDGSMRNSWAESNANDAFSEIDVRLGVRTTLETPFFWNPKGIIKGVVFKDLNGNQRKDEREEGIEGVVVKVGDHNVVTNKYGVYRSIIKAKRVDVSVDIDSTPKGFIFTTPVTQRVEVIHNKVRLVDFGLSTQSGVYGIVFVDSNDNKRPDKTDHFISGVEIALDKDQTAVSDADGAYFFQNVAPGKHEIKINMQSVPIQFLPQVKIKEVINVSEGTTYLYHILLKEAGSKE